MIKYALERQMKRRGLANAYALAEFAKIPPPLAYRLLSGKRLERIEVATLEALAKAFKVKPWTLLDWTPEPD
jgi:hypothetical protein